MSAGLVLCLAAIILTVNPGFRPTIVAKTMSYVVVPLQRGAAAVTGWVSGRVSVLVEMGRLREENAELREQNGRLSQENRRLLLAEEENKELSALLGISRKYAALPMVGAGIIGKDPNDWYNSFSINKGENDGLQNNMAVLGDFGLIGRIQEVHSTYAKIITIIDHRFSVAVEITRTEDLGVLKGAVELMQQGLCRVEYIIATAQIMVGDEIVTGSHSSMFPPGILVGKVQSVEPNPDGLTKYAIVEPAATINRIENVLVVTQIFGEENAATDEP